MEYTEIGNRLRIARNNCNLTQKDVCAKANIPKVQSLSSYEKGTTKIPVDTLARLCSIYGVTTDSIIYGEQSVIPLNNTLEDNIRLLVALVDTLEFPIREQLSGPSDNFRVPFGSYSIDFNTFRYLGLGDFVGKWKRLRDLLDSGVIDHEEYATLINNKLSSVWIKKVEDFVPQFGTAQREPVNGSTAHSRFDAQVGQPEQEDYNGND